MPHNLIKKYSDLLEILHLSQEDRQRSLFFIFTRDFGENPTLNFRTKKINPISVMTNEMMNLFTHLTTVTVEKAIRKREFEYDRSVRLHWIRFHLEELKKENMKVFSVKDPNGYRTYILDVDQNYVIILEPYRNGKEYYLLTAYHLRGGSVRKIESKYKRRLPQIL